MEQQYLGLGKTLYNSSACLLRETGEGLPEIEILLSERHNKAKSSGMSPLSLIPKFGPLLEGMQVAENSDVVFPAEKEEILDQNFPFFDSLKKQQLTSFTRAFNPGLVYVGHHLAHASAVVLRSPFAKALVFVMDGAGSSQKALEQFTQERVAAASPEAFEHLSVYGFEHGRLTLLKKRFMKFHRMPSLPFALGDSTGIFYELISKYIFNSQTDAGKVMGLAPFGKGDLQSDYVSFLSGLDWSRAFKGKGKSEWESSEHLSLYQKLAATVQLSFENDLFHALREISQEFPQYENLIMTGGCALNCTANWKVKKMGLFKDVYVCPYPGDESIGLGCASYGWLKDHGEEWVPTPWKDQHSCWGQKQKLEKQKIQEVFKDYFLSYPENIADEAARELEKGRIIAWFQGRSECGPRALGNRSILARPDKENLKDELNRSVKFRESFRPYGCSVLWEESHHYFDCEKGFHNPFMSYAVPVKTSQKELLKHVTHVDGTSRMQTVHRDQNNLFYDLLSHFHRRTGIPVLLNTSLNVMNEPILETVEDALRFFQSSVIETMVIGETIIRKAQHV